MANIITASRIPLLFLYLYMLYSQNSTLIFTAVLLIILFMAMDMLDGMAARKLGQTSLVGSVLDIAVDRIYELVLWFIFADMNLISIFIPLIVVIRTVLTDALRSLGVKEGTAPFKQHSLFWAKFLVASRWMRAVYGVSKVVAFSGLTLVLALKMQNFGRSDELLLYNVHIFFRGVSWFAVFLCIVRGLPIILNGFKLAFKIGLPE